MIRLLLVAIWIIIFCILSLILLPIGFIITKINRSASQKYAAALVKFVLKGILFLSGTKVIVKGLENIPKDEAVLFVGNHRSYFDVVVAYTLVPLKTGFVAKKEMNRLPIIRQWMRMLRCPFLDRDNIKEGLKTILRGIEYIKDGTSIVIFPEGTRNTGDGMLEFHAGSFKLSEKSGCKIIPMVQNNTDEIFEKHVPFIKRTKTIIEFLPAIDLNNMTRDEKKEVPAKVKSLILETYNNNKTLLNN
ncbi:lysophospholipid acyltransferase family protein [Lachnospira multipara]|uniref:lysophospholipid acyltransferase family protein n=1 Tax=Lachnospira multipara TaxID=28051 RepID=UPI000487B16F|nr:lysophospholipid acyltransferase family protein [Lachnospira multipara]